MPRTTSADRPMSIHAPIAGRVAELLDGKVLPILGEMPRAQVGQMLGVDPSAMNHYMKMGPDRTSLPTLPQIERLAAAAGFRVELNIVKDASATERILGDIPEYEPKRRGRKPATEAEKEAKAAVKAKAERKAAKEAKAAPAPKAKPAAKTAKASKAAPAKAAAPKAKAEKAVTKPKTAPAKKGKVTLTSELAVKKTPKATPTAKAAVGF